MARWLNYYIKKEIRNIVALRNTTQIGPLKPPRPCPSRLQLAEDGAHAHTLLNCALRALEINCALSAFPPLNIESAACRGLFTPTPCTIEPLKLQCIDVCAETKD